MSHCNGGIALINDDEISFVSVERDNMLRSLRFSASDNEFNRTPSESPVKITSD